MADEQEQIVKTKTRRFPEDIDDEDIELIMKEWRLAGYEVYSEARTVVGFEPDVGPERGKFLYHRYKDKWLWVDLAAADKAFIAMGTRLQAQAEALQKAQLRAQLSYPTETRSATGATGVTGAIEVRPLSTDLHSPGRGRSKNDG